MKEQVQTLENKMDPLFTEESSVSQIADFLEALGKEERKALIEKTAYLTAAKIGMVLKEIYSRKSEKERDSFWTVLGEIIKRVHELEGIRDRSWNHRFNRTSSEIDKGLLVEEEELEKAKEQSENPQQAESADHQDDVQQDSAALNPARQAEDETEEEETKVFYRKGGLVRLGGKKHNQNGPHSALNRSRNVIARDIHFPPGIDESNRDRYYYVIGQVIESDHIIPQQVGIKQDIQLLAIPKEEDTGQEKVFTCAEEVEAEFQRREEAARQALEEKASEEAALLNNETALEEENQEAQETVQAQEPLEENLQEEELQETSKSQELEKNQEDQKPLSLEKSQEAEESQEEFEPETMEESQDLAEPDLEDSISLDEPHLLSDQEILDPQQVLKDFSEADWASVLNLDSEKKNPNAQRIHEASPNRSLTSQEKEDIQNYLSKEYPDLGFVPFKEDIHFRVDGSVLKPAPFSHVLYGHNPSPEFLAWLIYEHLCLNIPITKLEKHLLLHNNVYIPKKTLNEWLLAACREYLVPMADMLYKIMLISNYLQLDETYLLCLQDRAEGKNTKGAVIGLNTQDHFLWAIASFFYRENLKMEFLTEILGEDWEGILQIDGNPRNPEKSTKIVFKGKTVGCWAHVRQYLVNAYREFKEVKEALKIKSRKERKAYMKQACLKNKPLEIVNLLLYHVDALQKNENEIERNGYDDEKTLKVRQSDSKGHAEKVDGLMKQLWLYKATMPILVKPVTYFRNHRDKLFAFLEDPKIKHSNMQIERLFKSAIQPYRRNSLFAASHEGAWLRCRALSVIKTAEMNGLNVEQFLIWAFTYLKDKRDSLGHIEEKDLFPFLPLFTNEIPDAVHLDKIYLKSGSLFQKLEEHPYLTAIPDKNNPLVFSLLNTEPELDTSQTVKLF